MSLSLYVVLSSIGSTSTLDLYSNINTITPFTYSIPSSLFLSGYNVICPDDSATSIIIKSNSSPCGGIIAATISISSLPTTSTTTTTTTAP